MNDISIFARRSTDNQWFTCEEAVGQCQGLKITQLSHQVEGMSWSKLGKTTATLALVTLSLGLLLRTDSVQAMWQEFKTGRRCEILTLKNATSVENYISEQNKIRKEKTLNNINKKAIKSFTIKLPQVQRTCFIPTHTEPRRTKVDLPSFTEEDALTISKFVKEQGEVQETVRFKASVTNELPCSVVVKEGSAEYIQMRQKRDRGRLGKGGSKSVYEMRVRQPGQPEKLVAEITVKGEYNIKNLEREIAIGQEIDSPYVDQSMHGLIRYSGAKTGEEKWSVEATLYDGSAYSLRDKCSFEEKLQIMIDAGRGLQAMHEKGYIHCDFKPENIFVTQVDGQKKGILGDLGEAKRLEDSTPENVMGTGQYLAPECDNERSGTQAQSDKSDLYSYGISLQIMFTRDVTNPHRHELEALWKNLTKREPKERPSLEQTLEKLEEIRKNVAQEHSNVR